MNTPIRHMTIGQYKTDIIPLIIELKKILRKKYLICAGYSGLEYLTYPQFITQQIKKGRKSSKINGFTSLDDNYYKERAEKKWDASKLKKDKIPTDLYNRYREIVDILSPLFIDPSKSDLSKLHKDNKSEVRLSISDDIYLEELKNGTINFDLINTVSDSLGIKVPKRLYDMKEKVSSGIYNREYVKLNKEFLKSIRNYLTPYTNELKQIKRDQLNGVIKSYLDSNMTNFYKYCSMNFGKDMGLYSEMNRFFKNGEKVPNINELIEKSCEDYVDQYINTFIHRIEDKTNLINVKWNIPEITFSNSRFSDSKLQTDFMLKYDNGNIITGDSRVIIAGGYIQCLHQRYLFNFYYNGKKVSLEQIDNLK